MVSFLVAESSLFSDVESRIMTLVPEREENIRFAKRETEADPLSEFEEETLIPRLFEIGPGRYVRHNYMGSSTRALKYNYEIKILYPIGSFWTSAALSDAERIKHDLLVNQPTATGVQLRHIDPEAEIQIINDEDSEIQIMTMQLFVYYEVV